jgi:hypothetical protein
LPRRSSLPGRFHRRIPCSHTTKAIPVKKIHRPLAAPSPSPLPSAKHLRVPAGGSCSCLLRCSRCWKPSGPETGL